MAENIGSAYIDVRLKLDKLSADIMTVNKKLESIGSFAKSISSAGNKGFKEFTGSIAKMVPGIGMVIDAFKSLSGITGNGLKFVKESIAAYQEQKIISARLGTVLQSTGAHAWTTYQQLTELANRQSKETGKSVQKIQQMQAVLLEFASISGDSFTQAADGIINIAAIMGGDLASAANQFGKALVTPAESLEILSRYGIKFSEEQKKMAQEFNLTGLFENMAVQINKAAESQLNFNSLLDSFKKAADSNNWKDWVIEEAQAYGFERDALDGIIQKIAQIAEIKKNMSETGINAENFGAYIKENYGQIVQQSAGLFREISSIAAAEIQRMAREDLKAAEKIHLEKLNLIKDELNEKLIAAGFAVANNQESLQAQLEAAIRIGDEVLIYQSQRALEKQRIEDEAAENEKSAKMELENAKNHIAYQAELQQWRWKMVMGIADAAAALMTVSKSWALPWSIPILALTAVQTGIQLATLGNAKPQPPTPVSLATGGIVPGSSFSGDRIPALLNSREGVFTLNDQEYLFDQIQNRQLNSAAVTATIIVMLDGREIGQNTFDLANKGYYTLKTRVIQG